MTFFVPRPWNNSSSGFIVSDLFLRYSGDEFIVLSNYPMLLWSNKYYTVGETKITSTLEKAIHEADIDMMREKNGIKK